MGPPGPAALGAGRARHWVLCGAQHGSACLSQAVTPRSAAGLGQGHESQRIPKTLLCWGALDCNEMLG